MKRLGHIAGILGLLLTGSAIAQTNLTFTVPEGHAIFSAVVDDAEGRRVRNLGAMRPVTNTTMTIAWDGLDEERKPVSPGTYTMRGISLPRLKLTYDYSFYNPGTPPWELSPGVGGWGADHTGPSGVACIPTNIPTPWRVMITCEISEHGEGVFAIGKKPEKVFGFKRDWAGSRAVAVDNDGLVYLVLWGHNALLRLDSRTAHVVPFQRPAGVISDVKLDSTGHSIAVSAEQIAVATQGDEKTNVKPKLLLLDKKEGRITVEKPLDWPRHVAFDRAGTLFIGLGTNGVATVDREGHFTSVPLKGLANAGVLCFDRENNLYVHDRGPDWQIKVFSPKRKLLRTIGKKGGQGKQLEWDGHILHDVSGIGVDEDGRVWIAEPAHPRRVAVFAKNGKLEREFFGATQYGAQHCFLHDQDPTRTAAYGLEFKIDPADTQNYRPRRFLSSGAKPGSPFAVLTYPPGFWRTQWFRSAVSGKEREYLYQAFAFGAVLFVEKRGDHRPCAALFNPMHYFVDTHTRSSPGFREGDPISVVKLWSDHNEDECIQDDELQVIPEFAKAAEPPAWVRPFGMGMGANLGFHVNARAILPVRFSASGAPIYDAARAEKFADALDNGYSNFEPVGRHLVGIQFAAQPFLGRHIFTDRTGRVIGWWKFERLALHGSQGSPMPMDGETAGEQFVSGIADIGADLGSVVAWHGNMGQAFLFSEDGIYLSSLFRDVRNAPQPWGDKVVKGADWTNVTMTQEPFGGWFGKQADGRVRYLFGRNAAMVVQVHGLEQARRFTAGVVALK